MQPLHPVTSKESPREILDADLKLLSGLLPIRGGWGYSKSDACIIERMIRLLTNHCPLTASVWSIFLLKKEYMKR